MSTTAFSAPGYLQPEDCSPTETAPTKTKPVTSICCAPLPCLLTYLYVIMSP